LIKDAKLKHAGEYTVSVSNHYGTKQITCKVNVLDKPGAVDAVEIYGITEERVRLQWQPPKETGGSEIQRYVVEKRETSRLIWTTVDDDCRQTSCTIKRLIKDNQYLFRVLPANKYGVGDPRETEAVIIRNQFTVPRAPGKPKSAGTTADSITVIWDRPAHDGDSTITGYQVERRNKKNINWVRACKAPVNECRLRVPGLQQGNEYEFRVAAINKAGIGEMSDASEYFIASDPLYPPSKPGVPKVVNTTENSVSLRWAKPIHDGGAPIKNYTLEMAQQTTAQEVEWKSVTALPIADTEFTITGLKEANQEVNFRVIASNDVGASDASVDCGWVLPEDIVEEPGFELDTECQRVMMIRAGQTIRMGLKLKGKPLPTIKWTKSEGEINELALTETVKNYAMLMIENSTVLDTGRYEFLLESSSGQKEGAINVRVMDAPSAPQNVTAGEVQGQEVKITWDAPANDGCANITHYIVEKRTASKKAYMTVSENCERDSIVIKGLITGESYFFRVTAVNKYGNGREGINAEPVIIASKPEQPLSIDVVEMTKNTGTIAWTKPHSDGGSPISGYIVEMAKSVVGAETWIKQGTTTKMTYTCRDLSEKAGYVFRVRAVNAIGASDATETRLSAVAIDEIIAPELDTKALYMSSYTVKAGEDVFLTLPVIGKPAPIVKSEY